MKELITLCGDDCVHCPRFNAAAEDELQRVAELWYRVGWRERVVSAEEMECTGCSSHKQCTYGLVECTKAHGVDRCGKCEQFPCERIAAMLARSEEYRRRCAQVCSSGEYAALEKAFFNKEANLKKDVPDSGQ